MVVGTTTTSAAGVAPIVQVSKDPAFTHFPAMANHSRIKDTTRTIDTANNMLREPDRWGTLTTRICNPAGVFNAKASNGDTRDRLGCRAERRPI